MRDRCAASNGWSNVRAPLAGGLTLSISCSMPGIGCRVSISVASVLPGSASSSSSSPPENSASAICSGAAGNGMVSGILRKNIHLRLETLLWI